jgi:hypothetical protein
MHREPLPQRAEHRERREYGFAEGVRASLDRLLELYEHTDHDLVVVINGSSTDVGKTYLQRDIERALMEHSIVTTNLGTGGRSDMLWRRQHIPDPVASGRRPFVVFFYVMQGFLIRKGEDYNARTGRDFLPVDLAVAIYRPDRPFEDNPQLKPLGDIVIRNELAVDNPHKLR